MIIRKQKIGWKIRNNMGSNEWCSELFYKKRKNLCKKSIDSEKAVERGVAVNIN